MTLPDNIEVLIRGLPDTAAARRFYSDLPQTDRINEALLSDLLTIAAFSPLLATTVLQNPEYIQWLGRERGDTKIRAKESLLESLSRFSLLHTGITPNVMLARFRRRELLRIYLRDIRRLATVAEITEELSNLADAVIEFALRIAKQDLDNRYGPPLETDERGRSGPAAFCVIALGKLGSKELNYSSDIDLLFIYSREGTTSETGTSGTLTNREYFTKLAEKVIAVAGGQLGEGAAYRIDMRLRPHGSIGRLALSLDETIRYYKNEAREWEQQVIIRSRAIAGKLSIYKQFYGNVEDFVFRPDTDVAKCLANVRQSKRRVEDPAPPGPGYNVKLGRGGIREIEFIAQALQLAYGGGDRWLRYPHTLVSLARLADRGLIGEKQLTALFDAYDFLRRIEHLLQMEHGLQTHTVPKNIDAYALASRRAGFAVESAFETEISRHAVNVRNVSDRVFGLVSIADRIESGTSKNDLAVVRDERRETYDRISAVSPHFAQMFASNTVTIAEIQRPFSDRLFSAIANERDFGKRLSILRRSWSASILSIVLAEIDDSLSAAESKDLQTDLAEASIEGALIVMRDEMSRRHGTDDIELSVLALGKLGGRGVDYGSDLDIVLVYPNGKIHQELTAAEAYNLAVEIFVTVLSGMTRDGNLYRVDLRLRPYGKDGASANPATVFVEYFQNTAALWELLAFVKLRGVAGGIAAEVETEVRNIIHDRARTVSTIELASEIRRIRYRLEREKGGRHSETDIKYGPGGMLDVYFATRFLQLRDNVPDTAANRSTLSVLELLWEQRALSENDFEALSDGYSFLSELDHNIRLVSGRSRRLPTAAEQLNTIARRMNLASYQTMLETLAMHRINVRRAFENILSA